MMTPRQREQYEAYVEAEAKGHDFRGCGNGEFFDGEPHDAAACDRMTKRMAGLPR